MSEVTYSDAFPLGVKFQAIADEDVIEVAQCTHT